MIGQKATRAVDTELTLNLSNGVDMKLVLIPAGNFRMGSPPKEINRCVDEGPQRRVTISKPFYMGVHEVTQEQYAAVMGVKTAASERKAHPAEGVSWHDAVEFCKRLSASTGREVRLPTEAEWEYACRAGTTTAFHTGETISSDEANFDGRYVYGSGQRGELRNKTTPVGSFKPNGFGLYDMHGNVWEWCSDWYDSEHYAKAKKRDPEGPASGTRRVVRGGSWAYAPWSARSAHRFRAVPSGGAFPQGLRVVVSTSPAGPLPIRIGEMKTGRWDIVVAEDASPSELHAAKEFADLFGQASGIRLAIARGTSTAEHHVFIGKSRAAKGSFPQLDVSGYGPEDFRILADGVHIAIAGGRPRGTLYGVYSFLEDYVGVRFLTADHTHVPKLDDSAVLPAVDRFYHPRFDYRYCIYCYGPNFNAQFAVRLRYNAAHGATQPEEHGGVTDLGRAGHSFYRQIPSSKYGKDHPEYYAEINGERRWKVDDDGGTWGTQPCLTNPEVIRIVTKAVLDDLARSPNSKYVAVGQNDNCYFCWCPQCHMVDDREGAQMGSLLQFVNAVADEVAKAYPGVTVCTFAYSYSRVPPKALKPRPNVMIEWCDIEACMFHPFGDPNCPTSALVCADLEDWGKLTDNIYCYAYAVNFFDWLLPCPNLRIFEKKFRFFADHGARGVHVDSHNIPGGEMFDLRNYLIANLLWDPSRDGQKLIDEFLDLHYGKAAPPIRRFLEFTHDRAQAGNLHPICLPPHSVEDFGLDQTVADEGLAAFDEALRLADDATVRARVEKASICAYRMAIEPAWRIMFEKDAKLDPKTAERMLPLVRRFFQLCREHGVARGGIFYQMDVVRDRMAALFGLKAEDL